MVGFFDEALAPMSRLRSGEALVFGVATLLALVHALDDAFVHRGPGLGLGQHALAGLIALAAGIAGVLAFPALRPGLRAALAFAFGGLALVNGMLHVLHIQKHGAAGGDLTGALAALAGLVLLGLAAAIPWRHRGEGTLAQSRARGARRAARVHLRARPGRAGDRRDAQVARAGRRTPERRL